MPFGPKVGNGVENGAFRPRGPKSEKLSRKRVEKVEKELKFPFFDSFSTPFLTFWTPGPEGPGNSFSTPFPTLDPKGPRTPLRGLKGRNVPSVCTATFGCCHGARVVVTWP